MNAADFVTALAETAPKKTALLAVGYASDEAVEFIQRYHCRPRAVPLDLVTYGDEALKLIKKWDVSGVSIGSLDLISQPVVSEHGVPVASVELDTIVFRPAEKDYVMLDHEVRGRVLCPVARDGRTLLDCLIYLADYFAKTGAEEVDPYNEQLDQSVKRRCMEALGGHKYDTFCTSLLGV